MKVGHWIRNSFVVAALSVAACIPARAALLTVNQSVVGDQTFDYAFTPALSGNTTVTLTDLLTPVAFDLLFFEINAGPTVLTPPNQSSPFSFSAVANTLYSLTVFAGAGASQGQNATHFFGKYHLTVSDIQVVPEPGVWLMMIGGIGLLGWMRLRKSETFG